MAEAVRLVSLSNHKNGQFVTSASSVTANSVVNQIFQSESLVLQKGLNGTKSTIQGVGTPDGLSLYQIHDSRQLVHQNAFSCTNSNHQIKKRTKFLIIIKMNINFAML